MKQDLHRFHLTVDRTVREGFQVTNITFRLPESLRAFDGYRIAQLTDLHFGPCTSEAHLERAFLLTQSYAPDLVVLTGDYIQHDAVGLHQKLATSVSTEIFGWKRYRRSVRVLAERLHALLHLLQPADGMIATYGNHDYLEGKSTIRRYLGQRVRFLENEHADIVKGNSRLRIVGVDDFNKGTIDVARALESSGAGCTTYQPEPNEKLFTLLLSHNPDITLHRDRDHINSVDLVLCGHTHGGQFRFPFIGAPVTRTGQRKHTFALSYYGDTPIYVSNGIGYGLMSKRILCPPEIVFIRFLTPGPSFSS